MSAIVGCTGGISVSASKSVITKIISEDEVGKTFALLSCGERISNLLGSTIFMTAYSATLDIWDGAAYMLDAAIYMMMLFIILFFGLDIRQRGYISEIPGEGEEKMPASSSSSVNDDLEKLGAQNGTAKFGVNGVKNEETTNIGEDPNVYISLSQNGEQRSPKTLKPGEKMAIVHAQTNTIFE